MKCPECLTNCQPGLERCACSHVFSSNATASSASPARARLLGGAVGALVGGMGRAVVTASILLYCQSQDVEFFRGSTESSRTYHLFVFSIASAGFGLLVGALAGATCRPGYGALFGGGLSAMFCLCLIVLPGNLMMALSGGGRTDYSTERGATVVGLVAMLAVGALAGGIGAAVGKRQLPS